MSVEENNQPGAFEKLLGEIETFSKSMPDNDGDGDKKIAAAANVANGGDGDNDEDDENEEASKPMAKSLQVTLADGSVVEAEDGTELVKSLMDRMTGTESLMAKSLEATFNLVKQQGEALKNQGQMIKSLQEKIVSMSSEGRGRKTVLDVHQQIMAGTSQNMAKSMGEGQMTQQEFMAKSNDAYKAGRINGVELTAIDVSIRSGQAVDQGVIAKVLGN